MTVPQATHLTLADTSRLLGEAIWIEERLFEVVGAFAEPEMPDQARVALSEVSRRHGWRAAQLRERLPEVPGFAAPDVVVAPSEGLDPVGLDAGATDAVGLDGLLRALEPPYARLDALYEDHIGRCSQVSDAAVARTLALVLTDLRIDRERLRTVL
jgi:hypothetical protein